MEHSMKQARHVLCCSLETRTCLNFVPIKCEDFSESVGLPCGCVFLLSLAGAITIKTCGEAKLTATLNSVCSPGHEGGPSSRLEMAGVRPVALPAPRVGGAWNTVSSCSQSLVQVSQGGRTGELAAPSSHGYHFPGMETPHSYQPT